MIKRYRFYRQYHGRFISLALAPDPVLFWGFFGGVMILAALMIFI